MLRNQVGNDDTSERVLFVTEDDQERLRTLIYEARLRNPRGTEYLDSLEGELATALTVSSSEIAADVVTMNSTVHLLDLDTGEQIIFTLVFPNEADMELSKVSVLAPIGTAVLGYRVGDVVTWRVPDGLRHLRVVEVLYQPEAVTGVS